MKRIKSAPANIAEMVNRKKPIRVSGVCADLVVFNSQEQEQEQEQEPKNQLNTITKTKLTLTPFKTQKNIEKTVNSIMLDYIENKQIIDTNDEGVLIISVLYYYICEKTFTKKNINEFMLFLIQIFIKYLFTHKLHTYYINHSEAIHSKIALLHHNIHIF
jgi:hypothetical protein